MIILGIESSCDESAAAIIRADKNDGIEVLSSVISSQIEIHKQYGGVVPEIAAREHVVNIIPVIDKAIKKSGIKKEEIDGIAVTIGPGLITSLISGIETAKNLSYAWDIPLLAVNHIEGHVYSGFIDNKINFPSLVLTVSGGHTILALMKAHGNYKILGETRDDAAGEAFDKAAKLMDIGYPGGPEISARAEEFETSGKKSTIKLPRPMLHSGDFDFSFSGLKTAIRYELEKDKNWKRRIPEYAWEFQEAVIDVLAIKTLKAAKLNSVKTVLLAGGVSANKALRERLKKDVSKKLRKVNFVCPDFKYSTDNAAMIAAAGYFKSKRQDFTDWRNLKVDCCADLA